MRTAYVETVYTESEWMKHMERNAKRIFVRWLKRKAKEWAVFITAIVITLTAISVVGYVASLL